MAKGYLLRKRNPTIKGSQHHHGPLSAVPPASTTAAAPAPAQTQPYISGAGQLVGMVSALLISQTVKGNWAV